MDRNIKKEILNRLKTVEGHARGLQRMVEEEQYCVDIVRQVLAVQRALDKVNGLILENHLATCVTTAIRSDQPTERERVIRELVGLFTDSPFPLPKNIIIDDTSVTGTDGVGCACGDHSLPTIGRESEVTP